MRKLNPIAQEAVHELMYVRFKGKGVENAKVKKKEFYDTLKKIKEKDMIQIPHTTIRAKFKEGCYALSEAGNYFRLTWKDESGYHQRYTNFKDDAKNRKDGSRPFKDLSCKFLKRTGKTLREAFGRSPQSMKKCVPGLFHWDSEEMEDSIWASVGKLDFSSHFPACACGALPDASTAIKVKGKAKPTEEYRFAFYVKSGFVAEYGEYDTSEWLNTKYRKAIFESEGKAKTRFRITPVDESEEETVLMKASECRLDDEMKGYYAAKLNAPKGSKERDDAKLALLKIVGMMEMNDERQYNEKPFAHIAAVTKARAIKKMLDLMKKIGEKNVISVIVDGVIFDNKKGIMLGDKEEFLGSIKEERHQAVARFRGHNQYVLKENGDTDKCHAGFDINVESDDPRDWKRSPAIDLRGSIQNELKMNIENLNKGDYWDD